MGLPDSENAMIVPLWHKEQNRQEGEGLQQDGASALQNLKLTTSEVKTVTKWKVTKGNQPETTQLWMSALII